LNKVKWGTGLPSDDIAQLRFLYGEAMPIPSRPGPVARGEIPTGPALGRERTSRSIRW
jgi:hypothetical protein